MLSDRTVYLNGDFVEWEKATVHVMSHSLARGSAIFEVIGLNQTEMGPSVFRLDEHVDRLFRTAALLSAELPLSKEGFESAVLATVRANSVSEGFVKVVCYYHETGFDILCSQKALDVCIVVVDPARDLEDYHPAPSRGVSACICKWRKLHPETAPVEAKVAGNYINGIMAGLEARSRGFDRGIMLDTQGFVAEASLESVFLVKDDALTACHLGTVLPSIGRKTLLEAAPRAGIKTVEKRVSPEALLESEEVFLCSSPDGIVPVNRIEGRVFDKVPGVVTEKLLTLLGEIRSGRNPEFRKWLFPATE
ncbi:MAG: aminotransferase class IV [Deltaproteobacteria bacterium]|nr:aminotransferase class IV [Deltaproteobacteria bacterium]